VTEAAVLAAVHRVTEVAVPVVLVTCVLALVVLGVLAIRRRGREPLPGRPRPRGGDERSGVDRSTSPAAAVVYVAVGLFVAEPVLDPYASEPPGVFGWLISVAGLVLSLAGAVLLVRIALAARRHGGPAR